MTTRWDVVSYYLDRVRSGVDDGVTVLDTLDLSTPDRIVRSQIYPGDVDGALEFPYAGSSEAPTYYVTDEVEVEFHVVIADEHVGSTDPETRARAAEVCRQMVGAIHGRTPADTDPRVEEFVGNPDPGQLTGPNLFAMTNGLGVAIAVYTFTQTIRYEYVNEEGAHG